MNAKYIMVRLLQKSRLSALNNCKISKKAKICGGGQFVNVSMKDYSYVGSNCTIINCDIEKFCSIANNCIIGGAAHPSEWGSTSPVFHVGRNILKKHFAKHYFNPSQNTYIGNDVWIGNNVLIKSGVKIGNGCIIGMGAVVTKDIPDYEIWGGNPAKFIRKRFPDDYISVLLKSKWWDMNDEEIRAIASNINDIEVFVNMLKKRLESCSGNIFSIHDI